MKIRVRYDNQITCIDVPEEDFTLMIQADYDERRAAAVDPSSIRPRSPQEIIEERFNRPDYNNWHRHWRHTDDNAIPRRLDHKVGFIGDHPDDAGNHGERSHFDVDAFPDTAGELATDQRDSYQEQCEMLRRVLKPDYADMIIAVHLDGLSLIEYAAIFDELHTQPTRALYDVMTQGSGDARKQPLWFLLTTAGTDRNSICWEVHQKALDIIEGRKDDPRFYPVLFGLPDDADWTDERNWYKANPSLDKTIAIDKVRDAFRKAQETPADENMFRQLRLNQWVKQSVRWMPMDKWDDCGGAVDAYELEGRECYAGLDLSSTSDLTAMVLVFPPRDEDEQYIVLPFFWLPEDTLQLRVRRDHVMYDKWERLGFIQTTEGNVVHYGFIEQFILKLGERFNIREIAYDRWNATMMVQTLEDDGFTMVPFGQGFRDMSPPTKELMRIVLERKLNHGGHPVLRWNMDNAFVRTDPAGNLKIDKEKSTEKVDGAVALVMALDRAMKNQNSSSVYDDRGLLIL